MAVVVGPAEAAVSTDRELRVRVQFPWQRGRAPLAGGLSGALTPGHEDTGHAPMDASASMPVRVACAAAGANWGEVFTPHIGTEVLVEFIDGDIDCPVIVGQLHAGSDDQPWPAGEDSGVNHPGVLSGWHAQSLDGQGFNQWVIDDATGQLRMRLASRGAASPWSELSMGHIISQSAQGASRGAWLGSGFYAHSDGWLSVRAPQGLLMSTTARQGSYASAQGTQMDAAQAVNQLKAAQKLGVSLGQSAAEQGALALHTHDKEAAQAVQGLLQGVDGDEQGKYTGAVAGQAAQKGEGRELKGAVERFAKPFVVIDTPSHLSWTSPALIAAYAGGDTSVSAQDDVHLVGRHTASFISGQTTSLYTHEGELQLITANGALSLRAHTDTLELLADQSVKIVSVNGEITVTAKRIEMVGGPSKIVLDGANITFTTPGAFTVKSATHAWAASGKGAAVVPQLPEGTMGEPVNFIELNHDYDDLEPRRNAPFKLTFSDGSVRTGTLDEQGFARLEGVPPGTAKLELGEDPRRMSMASKAVANAQAGQAVSDETAASLMGAVVA